MVVNRGKGPFEEDYSGMEVIKEDEKKGITEGGTQYRMY